MAPGARILTPASCDVAVAQHGYPLPARAAQGNSGHLLPYPVPQRANAAAEHTGRAHPTRVTWLSVLAAGTARPRPWGSRGHRHELVGRPHVWVEATAAPSERHRGGVRTLDLVEPWSTWWPRYEWRPMRPWSRDRMIHPSTKSHQPNTQRRCLVVLVRALWAPRAGLRRSAGLGRTRADHHQSPGRSAA